MMILRLEFTTPGGMEFTVPDEQAEELARAFFVLAGRPWVLTVPYGEGEARMLQPAIQAVRLIPETLQQSIAAYQSDSAPPELTPAAPSRSRRT